MIRRIDRGFIRLANRKGLAIAIVGVVALSSSALPYLIYARSLSPFSSWSFVTAYDEFSYLLAADTYASGRLTNPTHEMWRHFETFSVNHRPTYQSMYPPGQGLFLAIGQALTGHPIVGVWISMALASAAICYLLQAWFPPRWALLGGLLAALHARMALEWGGTYWGGGVAMLGGALTFGGLRHVLSRARARDSVLLALGLVLLANSRPFEGLVASLPALAVLGWWLVVTKRFGRGTRLLRVVAPMVSVLAIAAGGMAYYNYRVTESVFTIPYQVYLATHGAETPFVWQGMDDQAPSPVSAAEGPAESSIRFDEAGDADPVQATDVEWWFLAAYLRLLTHPLPIVTTVFKLLVQWAFYFGPVLSVPLVALLWGFEDRWTWFAISTGILTLLAVLTTTGAWPHYIAPVAPLTFAVAVQGSRHLGLQRRHGKRVGRHWMTTMVLLSFLYLIVFSALFPTLTKELRWAESRALVQAQLERTDDQHLVMVRYGSGHVWYKEWVHNRADIDEAKVVWARELDPDSNQRLLAYFEDRTVWLVEPDREPPLLVPYDARPSRP